MILKGILMISLLRGACIVVVLMVVAGFTVLAHRPETGIGKAGTGDGIIGGTRMKILRCTPIQIVDAIEPNLDFWENRLGYKRTAEVPPGAKQLDFVILEKDGLEVMLQTYKSMEADMSSAHSAERFQRKETILYIEVDSLEEAARALKGVPISMEPVDRPYGMREMTVKDPSGYAVCLAQKIKA